MKILETHDLKKYYGEGDTQVKALDGVDLSVEEGEFTAVVGTSGSGKSTLLHMLGGLDYATSGTVTVAGRKIFELNERDLTIFRRRQIGFFFQSYNLVAIARALVTKPAIILADEPTGNLDSKTTQEVLGLLKLTGEQFHQTIVMITHNEALAQLCDRVIHIEDGRIVSSDREVRA